MIAKINDITGLDLEEDKINTKMRRCVEKAILFVKTHRFVSYADSLNIKLEREIFEAEFIGTVWNKPDLTRDEVNLCVNLCKEYINQLKLEEYIELLNGIIAGLTEDKQGSLSMSIIKNISDCRDELKNSVVMQQKLNADINGSRNKRLESLKESSRSISQFFEYVQEEDNRKLLEKATELENQLLSKEMDRLIDASEIVARVYGVRKEDILE
jgi:hypothetical protein